MGFRTGHFRTCKRAAVKWNDAIRIGPRRLLVPEPVGSTALLRALNLLAATALLTHPRERGSGLGVGDPVRLARWDRGADREVTSLDRASALAGPGLEGVCAPGPGCFPRFQDRDFGIAEAGDRLAPRLCIVRIS